MELFKQKKRNLLFQSITHCIPEPFEKNLSRREKLPFIFTFARRIRIFTLLMDPNPTDSNSRRGLMPGG